MKRRLADNWLDSRAIFWIYAAIVGPVGLVAATNLGDLWAHQWVPYDYLTRVISILRVAGTMACGAAFAALAMGRLRDERERRRSLGWFAAAHTIVLLMLWSQVQAIWDYAPPLNTVLAWFVMAWAWLAGGWVRAGSMLPKPAMPLGPSDDGTTAVPRSAYEQRIRQIAAQEERGKLARDLHDSIKQQIFAIHTAAATADARLDGDQAGTRQAIAQVRAAARDASAEMDAMLDQLRITPLENAGLVEALKRQAEALRLRTGAEVVSAIDPLPPDDAWPPGAHLALFRAAQEALSNVARHARASKVRLTVSNHRGRLELSITDNGSGFDQSTVRAGMGLANIKTRLAEIGGHSTVVSREGEGTTVTLRLPYRDDAPASWAWHSSAMGLAAVSILLSMLTDWDKFYLVVPLVFVTVEFLRYFSGWRRARRLRAKAA